MDILAQDALQILKINIIYILLYHIIYKFEENVTI